MSAQIEFDQSLSKSIARILHPLFSDIEPARRTIIHLQTEGRGHGSRSPDEPPRPAAAPSAPPPAAALRLPPPPAAVESRRAAPALPRHSQLRLDGGDGPAARDGAAPVPGHGGRGAGTRPRGAPARAADADRPRAARLPARRVAEPDARLRGRRGGGDR